MLNQYPNLTYVVVFVVLVDDTGELVTCSHNYWSKSSIYFVSFPTCFSISYLFQLRTILISIFSGFFCVTRIHYRNWSNIDREIPDE